MQLSPEVLTAQWFVTLFAYTLPLPLALRFWDYLFVTGWVGVFKLAIAVLGCLEEELVCMDMEGLAIWMRKWRTQQEDLYEKLSEIKQTANRQRGVYGKYSGRSSFDNHHGDDQHIMDKSCHMKALLADEDFLSRSILNCSLPQLFSRAGKLLITSEVLWRFQESFAQEILNLSDYYFATHSDEDKNKRRRSEDNMGDVAEAALATVKSVPLNSPARPVKAMIIDRAKLGDELPSYWLMRYSHNLSYKSAYELRSYHAEIIALQAQVDRDKESIQARIIQACELERETQLLAIEAREEFDKCLVQVEYWSNQFHTALSDAQAVASAAANMVVNNSPKESTTQRILQSINRTVVSVGSMHQRSGVSPKHNSINVTSNAVESDSTNGKINSAIIESSNEDSNSVITTTPSKAQSHTKLLNLLADNKNVICSSSTPIFRTASTHSVDSADGDNMDNSASCDASSDLRELIMQLEQSHEPLSVDSLHSLSQVEQESIPVFTPRKSSTGTQSAGTPRTKKESGSPTSSLLSRGRLGSSNSQKSLLGMATANKVISAWQEPDQKDVTATVEEKSDQDTFSDPNSTIISTANSSSVGHRRANSEHFSYSYTEADLKESLKIDQDTVLESALDTPESTAVAAKDEKSDNDRPVPSTERQNDRIFRVKSDLLREFHFASNASRPAVDGLTISTISPRRDAAVVFEDDQCSDDQSDGLDMSQDQADSVASPVDQSRSIRLANNKLRSSHSHDLNEPEAYSKSIGSSSQLLAVASAEGSHSFGSKDVAALGDSKILLADKTKKEQSHSTGHRTNSPKLGSTFVKAWNSATKRFNSDASTVSKVEKSSNNSNNFQSLSFGSLSLTGKGKTFGGSNSRRKIEADSQQCQQLIIDVHR